MKSALFVDFDNVYSGLRKLDPMIAERFGRQPLEWVQWLIRDLALPEGAPTDAQRRLLVRRVYLNPQVYQRFRPSFNHGGFEIVDCPAMTSEGKTSTDIHMVLDMVDLLQHQVHYDEFIVFSADADFTPVLRKLRRWDRRTTVLAVGFPSAAYRASADLLIDTDQFVRDGLGMGQGVAREFEEPPPLADAVPALAPVSAPVVVESAGLPSVEALTERVRAEVQRADLPVPCARLAARLMHEYPGLSPEWLGQGGFRRFLESLPLAPLVLDWTASGGHLYDPVRHVLRPHTPLRTGIVAADWGIGPSLLALIRQVHDTTGVPLLSPRDFRALFEAVVADVAAQPFQLNDTGKRVRDHLRETGHDISRESVNWVLRGLLLCGHSFGAGEDDVATLTYRLVGNLINLCRREQVVMDDTAPAQLQHWLTGAVVEA